MVSAALSPAARKDVEEMLRWSLERFGAEAAARYRALLIQALRDLERDPLRAGSRPRPELAEDARTYPLAMSRISGGAKQVRSPRHFILYRTRGGVLQVARILHERRDLTRLAGDAG